ncbi:hypothetical protein M758_12G125400 [Ceratodon purpureus]|uniref:Uncharacterized protein n=1 Tax=Ceratodon purpureus TaxID=3225 RepID=A0A8T0GA30_CERPU|nr:hypothetical protein KC19_12G122800 [Ceratodon purpureus]KAG0599072.1 hypothetical protein M758_12G125400 [Ceratodon purpureus]KAG0599073.1 hypothetical protein M758_12G125400 [Ceratodon purpureus]
MTTWKAKLMGVRGLGGPCRSLFIVAVLAYLLGVLTSPAFPTTRRFSDTDVKLQPFQQIISQQISPPETSQGAPAPTSQPLPQRTSTPPRIDDCRKQQQPPGYRMLPTDLITFHTECKKEAMAPEAARKFLIDELFDGVSPFESFPPKEVASLLQPERIKGWGSETTVFRRLMQEVRPRVMIELGSFLGASATHMGSIARELGLQTDIFCFDDFRGWPGFRSGDLADIKQRNGNVMLMNQFMQNVVHRNLTERILPVPFGTVSSLSSFCKWGIYADLIEVDASHDFHSAWSDINIAFQLLRPGGVMFGHDYKTAADKRGVRRAVDLFARLNDLRVEPDGQHWIYRSKNK